MIQRIIIVLAFLSLLTGTWSCETDDLDPEMYFMDCNEVILNCFLADYTDSSASYSELWVGYKFNTYMTNENFIGHCWNFNTDTLPTIESIIRKEPYFPMKWDLTLLNYDFLDDGIPRVPFITGIPVSEMDTLITIRSFLMFNDSLIRYSPPLIIEHPLQYASK